MRYRSGFDREIGMYLSFLVVALVGAIASFAILNSIKNVDWSAEAKYDRLVNGNATEAAKAGTRSGRP